MDIPETGVHARRLEPLRAGYVSRALGVRTEGGKPERISPSALWFGKIEMHAYRNPFHNANYTGSKPVIETGARPKEYRGYQIFKIHDQNYDVVKDGVLVTQRAGPNGARQFVDDQV